MHRARSSTPSQSSAPRRAAAAVLVALVSVALAITGLGAVGTATAAPAATTISIRAQHPAVEPGGADRISGQLRIQGESAAGREVSLEAKAAGEDVFTPVGTVVAGSKGGLRLVVHPEVTTRYRWRYAGADDARPRVSGTVTVRMRTSEHQGRRVPTTLSIRVARPAVSPGQGTVVSGRLRAHRASIPGRWVALLARPAGADTWQFRDARRTGRAGQVHFPIRPRTKTAFRLAFSGTQVFRPSRSGVVHVGVRPAVRIAVAPRRVDPGESVTVSGSVIHRGDPVAGATVDLLARPSGRRSTWAVVASSTTATDGTVSFVATPTRDTRYRLHVHRTSDAPGSWSRVVVVDVRAPSSLSIRGRDTASGLVVTGQLRAQGHPVRRAAVDLQTLGSTGWTTVATKRTDRNGRVRFVRPSAPGTSYRLAYDGPRFASCTSATLTD